MADYKGAQPPDTYTQFDSVIGLQWARQITDFLQSIARLGDTQIFTGQNQFTVGNINNNGTITLKPGGFDYAVNVNKVSRSEVEGQFSGGNAAVYIQHLVDYSVCPTSTLNAGLRVQLESYQRAAAGVAVNGAVAAYFGLYNGGLNVGAFGMHVDAYHADNGSLSSMYGLSSEMYRFSPAGFTVGVHTRSIDQGAGTYNNDFAFLASPSVGGQKKFSSLFAGGSFFTGTILCDYGLDLRNASVSTAGIYMLDSIPLIWGDNIATHTRRLQGSQVNGRLEYITNQLIFAVDDSGIVEFAAGVIKGSAGGSASKFLQISDTAGNSYKIALLNP